MPNRIEARSAKAALTNATGRLPLLRLFSTPLIDRVAGVIEDRQLSSFREPVRLQRPRRRSIPPLSATLP